MTSNAYVATDGEKLMKVGKANDILRRELQIALPITCSVACLDEGAAYRVESKLRDFVVECGGIRQTAIIDWFAFDPQIYKMLCEFAGGIDGFEPIPVKVETEADINAEIAMLRKRYFKLLENELREELNRLRAEKTKLDEEHQRLKEEISLLQRSRWMSIEQLIELYDDKHHEFIRMLKEKDEAYRQALQQKDSEIARALQQKNDEIMQVLVEKNSAIVTTLEQSFAMQTETYLRNVTQYLAPLHEEIGELKAELRFLQERYGSQE